MNASFCHVKTMGHVSILLGRIFVTVHSAGKIKIAKMVSIFFSNPDSHHWYLWIVLNCISSFSDVDECSDDPPCQNNGTCINNFGSYTCTCTDGWEDKDCTEG